MTTPPFASDAEIIEIGEGFLDHSLPAARWTHNAHYAAVVWLIRARPDLNAERDMPDLIRGYNAARGGRNTDTEGYHETITIASLRATRAFLATLPAEVSLCEAVNAIAASPYGRSDWFMAYWSRDALFSVDARRGWVEADLANLPF